MGVVEQLWRHCVLLYFHVFRLTNEGNLLFAVMFLSAYVDFVRHGT